MNSGNRATWIKLYNREKTPGFCATCLVIGGGTEVEVVSASFRCFIFLCKAENNHYSAHAQKFSYLVLQATCVAKLDSR